MFLFQYFNRSARISGMELIYIYVANYPIKFSQLVEKY